MLLPTPKLHLFLCHTTQDLTIARELYRQLSQEAWIEPWLAAENLLPGMDWDLEIRKAIKAADAVVMLLSNQSISKEGYVQRELRMTLDAAELKPEDAIFIIPLRLDDYAVPTRLEKWQYIDFFPPRRKKDAYERLRQSLGLRAKALGISGFEAATPADKGARPEPRDPITASRIRDLEGHLRDAQKLLKEYEEIFRLSNNPKEQERAKKEIKALRTQISQHQKELEALTGRESPIGSKPAQVINIHTGGGAYINGDVNIQKGDFVGHDKVNHNTNVGDIDDGSSTNAASPDVNDDTDVSSLDELPGSTGDTP